MDQQKTIDLINPMNHKEVFSKRVPKDPAELTSKSRCVFKASVIVVCSWAVIEAPLEFGGSIDTIWLLAVVASKVLMCLIGAAAIAHLRFSRQVFTFICGTSVLAVAPVLPLEYMCCFPIALFSTVECIAKAVCVASFVIVSLTGDSGLENLSVLNRAADD